MLSKLKKNVFGFYEVEEKPSLEELAVYYSQKYYQDTISKTYSKFYSDDEIKLIEFRVASRYDALLNVSKGDLKTFLDVGCGEGFSLKYFFNQGFSVEGLDFSSAGVLQHNPSLIDKVTIGDINKLVANKIENLGTYDVVWLQNVLEHVIDPVSLMKNIKNIVSEDGVLVLTIPNDFSCLQLRALELGLVDSEYWVTLPDHLSYFNVNTILNFVDQLGWTVLDQLADFPIDWFLMNEQSNYISKSEVGANAHQARLRLEALISENNMSMVNQFYRALSAIGMGRNIVLFLRKNA
jgi:2-polyprenyl-3-methyl-5-hydroxy-6-metoxy-1,4-benzoquinol methylase